MGKQFSLVLEKPTARYIVLRFILQSQPLKICVNVVDTDQILQLYHEIWGHMDKCYVSMKLEFDLGVKVKLNRAY